MLIKIKFIILTIIIFGAIFSGFYYFETTLPVSKNPNEQLFAIQKGETAKQIAQKLKESGFIRSDFYFYLYSLKNNLDDKFQAGAYSLSPSSNAREIALALTQGQVINSELSLTFKEGWTINAMGNYLNEKIPTLSDEFMRLAKTPLSDWPFEYPMPAFLNKAPKTADLEGYLFPDTYRIFADSPADIIIQKMLYNFDKKLTDEARATIETRGKTIHEIVIMSSIVEKEVQAANDMQLVAGIFYNRLNSNMKLDSDATLTYALDDKTAAHTYDDLQNDTPYNTYRFKGLPPGPISNPGLNAIESTVSPKKSDYYYFLTGADNKTYFAKTYDEHLQNKAKYMK